MILEQAKRTRQSVLNDIVQTLEFIDYLKYEALVPVRHIISREEKKKKQLIDAFRNYIR